eukprot:CCRYP_011993-RA/>CCRYP_011993-RA protein AED:0.08 eAED:0.08 QI:154/1/1/1/0.75/0.6/5/844/287
MLHFVFLTKLSDRMASIQSILNFEGWNGYPQFETKMGHGRVALIASILCTVLGMHLVLCLEVALVRFGILSIDVLGDSTFWTKDTLQMALQWTVYIIFLCTFHLGEFFATSLFNPSVTTADSFMVNHSKAYSAAALISWVEFIVRFLFSPKTNSTFIFFVGLGFVIGGQICRTWAMVTCGESFNHYIQRDKKDNHVLVTHGIYSFLRHPSYVGFFYWAVGTQLLLCNPLSTALYGLAAWTFFRHRIVYEEATLRALFPGDYEHYGSKTYIGIPLINRFVNTANAKDE